MLSIQLGNRLKDRVQFPVGTETSSATASRLTGSGSHSASYPIQLGDLGVDRMQSKVTPGLNDVWGT